MSKYPAEIEVGESRLEHDRRRVLVAFSGPMDREEAQEAVDQLGLQLEPDEVVKVGEEGEETEQWTRRVGHTNTHFFFQAGEEIDDDRYEDLTNVGGVTGIVPIYRRSGTSDLSGLSAVFPTDIAIEYADGVDEATAEEIEASHGLRRMGEFEQGWVRYELSEPTGSAFEVAAALSGDANPDVVRTEYNTAPVKSPFASAPNDPRYPPAGAAPGQWNLRKIKWDQIWNTTGQPNIVIGILDTGVQSNHEEFGSRVRTPTGWSGDPDTSRPDQAHGTRVAGVAAARANNALGIAGIAGGCELYPIALPEGSGGAPYSAFDLGDAITDAAAANVSVINISLDLGQFNGYLENRITANASNAVFCVAAGDASTVGYPASHPDVISVGAIDDTDALFASPPGADVVAPGKDIWTTDYDTAGGGSATDRYYSDFDGTSAATPHVAGLAALVRSEYPGLTAAETRTLLEATCDTLPSGERLINAQRAVERFNIELDTSSVSFVDVREGETPRKNVVFDVWTPFDIKLTVTGPTTDDPTVGTFEIGQSPPDEVTIPAGTQGSFDIPIDFTAESANRDTDGSVTFSCEQVDTPFEVTLSANTTRRAAAVALVLDESGSMGQPSGLVSETGSVRSRMDELHDAVENSFIPLLGDDDAVGLVSFSTVVNQEEPIRSGRSHQMRVRDDAVALSPKQYTALGDGIEAGNELLESVDQNDYGTRAIVSLSDGCNNTGTPLDQVQTDSGVEVYAIGMGTPEQVCPDGLEKVVRSSDGYVLVTGAFGPEDDDVFKLDRYFQQVLAGVTNKEIVLDPTGRLRPGQEFSRTVSLTEADTAVDVIVNAPPEVVSLTLVAPNGETFDPTQYPPIPGAVYRTANRAMRYSLELPVDTGSATVGPGTWRVVLRADEEYRGASRAVRYNLSVHARSNVRLDATLGQDGFEPGATMFLRARMTENGAPMEQTAKVEATVELPDGGERDIDLEPTADEVGVYETRLPAPVLGTYHVHLFVEGRTRNGSRFTRERLLDGAVFYPDERSMDERRRDDVVDRDDRDRRRDEDDGPDIDIGIDIDDIIGRIRGRVRPPVGGWNPVVPDYRLLRKPEYVDALADISRLLREVEAEDKDEDEDDR